MLASPSLATSHATHDVPAPGTAQHQWVLWEPVLFGDPVEVVSGDALLPHRCPFGVAQHFVAFGVPFGHVNRLALSFAPAIPQHRHFKEGHGDGQSQRRWLLMMGGHERAGPVRAGVMTVSTGRARGSHHPHHAPAPPFNPERVVEEFAEVLARYRVRVVVGDRYGGDWPAAAFKRRSIVYRPADRTRSEIYRDVVPLLTSGAVELLDDPRLTRQLLALGRRTTMGGRDAIDHPAGAHDDVANAMAGALLLASEGRRRGLGFRSDVGEIRVVPADRGLDLPPARDVRIRQF
jgi:hypothetical protein